MKLDQRKTVILTTIIKNYLETGEPVGSRTISKYSGLNLSSATIRNEMSDLEEMGYIIQPHTSAGRIPSDKGYRFYVDQLMEHHEQKLEEVRNEMFRKVDRLEGTLKSLVRTLARNTEYAALVSAPALHSNKIKFLQVSVVGESRLLLVIVMKGNIVRTATLETEGNEFPDIQGIMALNLLLNDELSGLSARDIDENVKERIISRTRFTNLTATLLKLIQDLLMTEESQEIFTSGATNIFKYPELTEADSATRLLSALEQKEELQDLLEEDTDGSGKDGGIQIYIGDEAPLSGMSDCSVVTASYELGGGMKGKIGVIGPKRMDYEKVLGVLSHLQKEIEKGFFEL